MYTHVLREAHRLQHLWPEHTAVADLDPLFEHGVVGEDLQRRLVHLCESQLGSPTAYANLCVRIVGRLEAQLLQTQLCEENTHEPLNLLAL
jgi:hypothetical protein